MPLKLKKEVILVVFFLTLASFCWPTSEAKAQTNLRQSLVTSDQNRNLFAYYICLHMNLKDYGYSDTYGYKTSAFTYLQNAYSSAQQAVQYSLQDYNNGVTTTYYKAYNEYTTFSAIQNFLAIVVYYANLSQTTNVDNATDFQYTKTALDNFYAACILYDVAAIYAGCFPQ